MCTLGNFSTGCVICRAKILSDRRNGRSRKRFKNMKYVLTRLSEIYKGSKVNLEDWDFVVRLPLPIWCNNCYDTLTKVDNLHSTIIDAQVKVIEEVIKC